MLERDFPEEKKFPCGKCSEEVYDDDNAVCCDSCSKWYHCQCIPLTEKQFSNLVNNSHKSWSCSSCDEQDLVLDLVDLSFLFQEQVSFTNTNQSNGTNRPRRKCMIPSKFKDFSLI